MGHAGFQRILVGIDGHEAAIVGARTAAQFAQPSRRVIITLLGVVPRPSYLAGYGASLEALRADAVDDALDWIATALEQVPPEIGIRSRVDVGTFAQVVLGELEREPHDAVVICHRRRGVLASRLRGRNAGSIAPRCDVPVIHVPLRPTVPTGG